MFATFNLRQTEPLLISKEPIPLIGNSFCGLVVGPPGSGKSRIISDMLYNTKALYKKFDLVLFLVPYVEAFDIKIPEDRWSSNMSLEWLKERILHEQSIRQITNTLIIIDDLVSSINSKHMSSEMIDFFFNRRKMIDGVEISIIVSTQKFTVMPAKYRSSLQWIICFQVPPEDFKLITKQHVFKSIPDFGILAANHWRKQYNFLFFKIDSKPGVFLNFDKLLS